MPCSTGKVDYKSEGTAIKATEVMHEKTGDHYDAFQCDECGGWHIGHSFSYHGEGEVKEFFGGRLQVITEKDGTRIINFSV